MSIFPAFCIHMLRNDWMHLLFQCFYMSLFSSERGESSGNPIRVGCLFFSPYNICVLIAKWKVSFGPLAYLSAHMRFHPWGWCLFTSIVNHASGMFSESIPSWPPYPTIFSPALIYSNVLCKVILYFISQYPASQYVTQWNNNHCD